MRLVVASLLAAATLVSTITVCWAQQGTASEHVHRIAPVVRRAPIQEILIETPGGRRHVILRPLPPGPIDRRDPWTNQAVPATIAHASLDTSDPWSGQRLSGTIARPSLDTSDPWAK